MSRYMTFKTSILTALKLTFKVEEISSQLDTEIDAMLSLRSDTKICAYVIIAKDINDVKMNSTIRSITISKSQDKLGKLPIIIFKQDANNTMFGILSYWDLDRYFINNNIVWREYNSSNINWLITQISTRRGAIKLLDSNMCRVVKTIYLNHDDINDGEIKYLRSFSKIYKMKDTSMISDEERLNRLIHGTPEEDYPNDELDEVLFHQILKTYPNAKVKSSLLLFDSELLDLRFLKARKLHLFYISFVPILYNDLGLPQNIPMHNNELTMELYYTPNFFRETNILPIGPVVPLYGNNNDFVAIVKNTYQPLSAINI